jgi:hypothetical protein
MTPTTFPYTTAMKRAPRTESYHQNDVLIYSSNMDSEVADDTSIV